MANILIIGASGFIGQNLAKKLLTTKNNIFLVSRKKSFKLPGSKMYYGDLGSPVFCRKILKNINLVYYLAGYKKNLKYHLGEPYQFFIGNTLPFLNFLEALKKSKVKKVVYTSTINTHYINLEKDIDGYGLGKYANEIALKAFQAEYPKIDIKIVRPTMVYGPGDDFNPKTANFLPGIIDRIAKSDKELIVWGKGTRKLQFIYLDDMIKNLIAIPNRKEKLFSLGNPEAKSVNQIVRLIVKLSGRKLTLKNDLTKPDKPSVLFKFNNPIKSRTTLTQGLKKLIDWYYHKS